jgi:hypothetical protein
MCITPKKGEESSYYSVGSRKWRNPRERECEAKDELSCSEELRATWARKESVEDQAHKGDEPCQAERRRHVRKGGEYSRETSE